MSPATPTAPRTPDSPDPVEPTDTEPTDSTDVTPVPADPAGRLAGLLAAIGPGTRTRTLLQAAGLAVVLVLMLIGGDAVARTGAETLLARNVQDATGSATTPEVTVRGMFFLPQVIRGAYTEVDVTTRGITSGPLRIDRVDSRLTDVRLPFHDVLVRDIRTVGIGHSDEQVVLRYDDLTSYLNATGRPLQLARRDDGKLTITGQVDVLNQQLPVTADVEVGVSSGQLTITPVSVDTGGATMSQAAQLLLNQRLRLTISLGAMPFGHELTKVTVGDNAIIVAATGNRIILQP